MSSTVVENVEPVDDRLEIVLRDPFLNSRQIKLGFVGVALLWLAPLTYSIQGTLNEAHYNSSGFVLLLTFSGLGSLGFLIFLLTQIKRVHRLVITPSAIEIRRHSETKTLRTDDISEISVATLRGLQKRASLVVSITLGRSNSETFSLSASELITSGQLSVLLDGLRSLKKPLIDVQKALYALRIGLDLPNNFELFDLQEQLGDERIRIKIFEGNERTDRFILTRGHILIWVAVLGLCSALVFIYQKGSSSLFPIAITLPILFQIFQKPLWLVVGRDGIGVWSNGTFAYGMPLKALRSIRFEESSVLRDDNRPKVIFQFLNGEELRFELKPRTPEDRETLRQIAQEFKELKHGD